jgi:hypothetical protein
MQFELRVTQQLDKTAILQSIAICKRLDGIEAARLRTY